MHGLPNLKIRYAVQLSIKILFVKKKIENLILFFTLCLENNPEISKSPSGRELEVGVRPTIWEINLMRSSQRWGINMDSD